MGMTVLTLRDLEPARFRSVGFDDASPLAREASRSFDGGVRRIVDSGTAWSGEGQPQAARVMETNSLALEIAKVQMAAGVLAVGALEIAVRKAKTELDYLDAEAASKHEEYYIEDSGTVTYAELSPTEAAADGDYEPTGQHAPLLDEVDEQLTHRVQALLNYVDHADLTTARLLDRIANSCPVFSAAVSGDALTYNSGLLGLAYENLAGGVQAIGLWTALPAEDWGGEIPSWWEGAINGVLGALLPGWDDAGTTAAEGYLDVTGREAALAVFKRASLYYTIGEGLYGGLKGAQLEERLPDLLGPVSLLPLRRSGYDPELQELIDDYYLDPSSDPAEGGFSTLEEAAQLQRAGSPDVTDEDYLERASDLRDQLADWLEESNEISYPSEIHVEERDGEQVVIDRELVPRAVVDDRKTARDLIDRLDGVLHDR